ncbi:LOW QUALITY PROTEIN: UPF0764 protein C16orf89 [Plecturocebus cupreus]
MLARIVLNSHGVPPASAAQNTGITDGLALSPRLECRGLNTAYCSLEFSGSSGPPASASQSLAVAQAGMQWRHFSLPPKFKQFSCLSLLSSWNFRRTSSRPANFCVFKTGFHHVDQAGHKLLTSSDPPTLASQSPGITGVSLSALSL